MAFADAFDMAFCIKNDLQVMLKRYIPLNMFTDSLSLFHGMTTSTTTTEKLLMIYLKSVKECYQKKEIDNIAHVRTNFNPTDALTKFKRNSVLKLTLSDGKLEHPVDQWIIRQNKAHFKSSNNIDIYEKKTGDC